VSTRSHKHASELPSTIPSGEGHDCKKRLSYPSPALEHRPHGKALTSSLAVGIQVDAGADWTIADTGGRVAVQMAKGAREPQLPQDPGGGAGAGDESGEAECLVVMVTVLNGDDLSR
jgi:hypothetical protein